MIRRLRPNPVVHYHHGHTVVKLILRSGEEFSCDIDTKDYDKIRRFRWHIIKADIFYAGTTIRGEDGKQTVLYMHRLLLPNSEEVDHRDGNGLNNRRSNLRPATESQNKANRRKCSTQKSSQYRGVSLDKNTNKFRVHLMFEGRVYRLGSFVSQIEAARVYDAKAVELFGEFANINFPVVKNNG